MNRSRLPNVISRRAATAGSDDRGFVLPEILVAFVVLVLSLGIILSGVSTALHADSHTMGNLAILRVAQSRMEAAGITEPLIVGQRKGVVANSYNWQETITPIQIGPRGAARGAVPEQSANNTDLTPFWVEIMVRAKDGTRTTLAALKLGPESKK